MNPLVNSMQGSGIASAMRAINMLRNGNPEQILAQMMSNNPQFRQFVEQNRGKSVEQIAADYGVDLSMVRNVLDHK